MRFRIAAFVATFICGFITRGFYLMYIDIKKKEEDSLYPIYPPSENGLIATIIFLCFTILLFLYSVGLLDIIGDTLYNWLAPYPRNSNVMMHHQ